MSAVEPEGQTEREEVIARIIDPYVWLQRDHTLRREEQLKDDPNRYYMSSHLEAMGKVDKIVAPSLKKANAILAALNLTVAAEPSGEGR